MRTDLNANAAGTGLGTGIGTDAALGQLRGAAARNPKAQVREVSRQFEALFMQELLKSMRATSLGDGMLENQATGLGRDMLDQQYALQMAGQPGGLAQAIARQLERQMGGQEAAAKSPGGALPITPVDGGGVGPLRRAAASAAAGTGDTAAPASASAPAGANPPDVPGTQGAPGAAEAGRVAAHDALPRPGGDARRFVEYHQDAVRTVAAESGIPPELMLAQAAHETGWGRREIKGGDGTNSHNLFGIKADGSWKGPAVTITTTEVVDGEAIKVKARFRAYGSYEDSFRDYAKLIGSNARYASAMRSVDNPGAFARQLQRAGYATDPDYAAKLTRVIQTTQRLQRSLDRTAGTEA